MDDCDEALPEATPAKGLVAAVLCRQPLDKAAKEEEALQVISTMMIGLVTVEDSSENDGVDKGPASSLVAPGGVSVNAHDEESNEVWEDIEEPIDPLFLAGVTSEGLICIYPIWSLLSTSETNSGREKDDDASSNKRAVLSEAQAVTSWLLGADLFARLESTWLPLSQPRTTISLSVLNDTRKRFHHSDNSMVGKDSSYFSSTAPGSVKDALTSWNPWIEASTLRHRTVLNRVTSIHVVSSNYPFLVLLGQGERLMGHTAESSQVGEFVTVEKEGTATAPEESEEEWWKYHEADEADSSTPNPGDNKSSKLQNIGHKEGRHEFSTAGGFVTLCSMASWVESKTLFLDFSPVSVTYVERWHGMQLLLCLGNKRAVAIRLDAVPVPVLVGMDEDLEAMLRGEEGYAGMAGQHPTLQVPRYALLPVDIPSAVLGSGANGIARRILCADATTTPSLLHLYAESDGAFQMGLLVVTKFIGMSGKGAVITSTQNNAAAQLPAHRSDDSRSLLESSWGYLGQGWSLFGTGNQTLFLCWEGATATREMAYIHELVDSPVNIQSIRSTARVLVPSKSKNRVNRDQASLRSNILSGEGGLADDSTPSRKNSISDTVNRTLSGDDLTVDESTILQDLEIMAPTYKERSERILQKVSSWTQLEDTDESRHRLARKIPVIALQSLVRDGTTENLRLHVLNMRQVVIENGPGSPFSQILCWLSQKQDYFTAASIALDMLQDPDTLYHLWKHAEKIDEEDEQSKLNGLLDGIIPIDITEKAEPTGAPTTVRQLADMTVGCLIKGGLAMSRTLSRFLHFNKHYDPERASLMLVAAAVGALSGDPESVSSIMGSKRSEGQGFSIHEILWPVECLLEIAVERDYLQSTLNILNSNIPDELRCQPRPALGDMRQPSSDLELTKALVTMIISRSRQAVDLLLDLPNDSSSSTFWASLDAVTQKSLALLCIGGGYPMLLHEEVRDWARGLLQGGLDNTILVPPSSLGTDWLQEVVPACLVNAGCNLSDFVFEPTNASMTSLNSENSANWVDIELDGEDGLYQLKLQILETRVALEPSPGSCGLDFDILITALLLLESRSASWNEKEDRCISTQGLLDAACHLAGRPRSTTEQPRFSLDAGTLMQECARYGNVRAGANLIGGKNGFVLSCCDVLMTELQVPIEKAESFFLKESNDVSQMIPKEASRLDEKNDFELTDSHRHLLWLLDEWVLSVRTFGDFDVGLNPQGRVDPVFAARSIFRAWLCLTESCRLSASRWISEWLCARLGLTNQRSNVHRLACTAIARALLWRGTVENEESWNSDMSDPPLGHLLEMDTYFLIQLAQASCGLMESVPPIVAEALISLSEVTSTAEFQTSFAASKRFRSSVRR